MRDQHEEHDGRTKATENSNTNGNGNSIDGHLGAQIAVAGMPTRFYQLQSLLLLQLPFVTFV